MFFPDMVCQILNINITPDILNNVITEDVVIVLLVDIVEGI